MLLKMFKDDGKVTIADITRRHIKYLVHVTKKENVKSILEQGIISHDGVRLSVSQVDPHHFAGRKDEYAAILVNPLILCERPCLCFAIGSRFYLDEICDSSCLDYNTELMDIYCDADYTDYEDIDYTRRDKFNALFENVELEDYDCVFERKDKCPSFQPTLSTADILVQGTIPSNMIKGVAFNGYKPWKEYTEEHGKVPGYASIPSIFGSGKWQYSSKDVKIAISQSFYSDYDEWDNWRDAFPDSDGYSSYDEYLALNGLD